MNDTRQQNPNSQKNLSVKKENAQPAKEPGKWKWMVLFGTFFINLILEGSFNAFGVFFTDLCSYFGGSKSHVSWIGSLFFSLPLIGGAFASLVVVKFGSRFASCLGGVVASIGILTSIFATSVLHMYLTFGCVAGLANSLPQAATVLVLCEYFDKNLGLASGIAECGACVGTVVLPIIFETLLTTYGWRGAILLMSGFTLNIIVCGSLFRPGPINVDGFSIAVVKTNDTSTAKPSDLTNKNGYIIIDDQLNLYSKDWQGFVSEDELSTCSQDTDLPSCVSDQGHRSAASKIQNSPAPDKSGMLSPDSSSIFSSPTPNVTPTSPASEVASKQTEMAMENEDTLDTVNADVVETDQPETSPDGTDIEKSFFVTCAITLRLGIFKNAQFAIYVLFVFMLYIWVDVPYFFLPDRAIELGFQRRKAALLLSIIGILQFSGNLLFGFASDKKCVHNATMLGCSVTISGLALALIPLAKTFETLSVLAGVFGFFIAAVESLSTVMLVEFVGFKDLGIAYGYTLMVKGLAELVGPPVGGWLYDISGSYDMTFLVTGVCLAICGVIYTTTAVIIHKKKNKYA